MKKEEFKKLQNEARKEYEKWAEQHESKPMAKTNRDVLLERWAHDTETMAKATVDRYYDDEDGWFVLPDGFATGDPDAAIDHYIAYLNSAAEVGK